LYRALAKLRQSLVIKFSGILFFHVQRVAQAKLNVYTILHTLIYEHLLIFY
jgi:hypothetical protein